MSYFGTTINDLGAEEMKKKIGGLPPGRNEIQKGVNKEKINSFPIFPHKEKINSFPIFPPPPGH